MYWGSREEQDKRVKTEVAARREAAAAFPFIRPVLQQFNGKVYNCRFEKALQEAAEGKAPGRVYARKDDYWVTVNYYPSTGHVGTAYGLTLCQMKTEALIDGKRLDGKALDDSLRNAAPRFSVRRRRLKNRRNRWSFSKSELRKRNAFWKA